MEMSMPNYLNPTLRDLWDYNPDTGKFTSKIVTYGYGGVIQIGDEVGTLKDGYVQLGHHGTVYRAHILAWVWQTGSLPPKGKELDHENKIRNDNRMDNLRLLTRGANNLNHNGPRIDSTTGARGVYRGSRGKAWFARITVDGKIIHLGTFQTIEEAIAARKAAEVKFWNTMRTN